MHLITKTVCVKCSSDQLFILPGEHLAVCVPCRISNPIRETRNILRERNLLEIQNIPLEEEFFSGCVQCGFSVLIPYIPDDNEGYMICMNCRAQQ